MRQLYCCDITDIRRVPPYLLIGLSKLAQTFAVRFLKSSAIHPICINAWGSFSFKASAHYTTRCSYDSASHEQTPHTTPAERRAPRLAHVHLLCHSKCAIEGHKQVLKIRHVKSPRVDPQVSHMKLECMVTSRMRHSTVEPRYNEVLGTMKITLLYQVSHYIRVKKQRNIKRWDHQNDLVIRGFCYIRPLYNEVPLY